MLLMGRILGLLPVVLMAMKTHSKIINRRIAMPRDIVQSIERLHS